MRCFDNNWLITQVIKDNEIGKIKKNQCYVNINNKKLKIKTYEKVDVKDSF